MMDERLYRETFSRLRASGEAKKEVLVKMNEMNKKTMRRPVALAAMLTLALAVSANAATNGELFENMRIIFRTIPASCWKTTREHGWRSPASLRTRSSRTAS